MRWFTTEECVVTALYLPHTDIHPLVTAFRDDRGEISKEGAMAKVGRNDPCPRGSAKKSKRCCFSPERLAAESQVNGALVGENTMRPIGCPREPLSQVFRRDFGL